MKEIIENLMLGITAAAILAGLPVLALSQYRLPAPPVEPEVAERASKIHPPLPMLWGGDTSEKSIKVDSSVTLSLCISQGNVKVNGWNRSEVRVYVENGSKFGFNVRDKDARSGDPNWISFKSVETRGKYATSSECISGNDIEIDAPVNATVSIKGHEITTKIDSVKKAEIETLGGDISLRNITGGMSAKSGQGDVTVEASTGPMTLVTTTGNIVVFEAKPGAIGDLFKANTNGGTISLQDLLHRQIEVGTISGSVLYNGVIRSGGSYNLNTSNGSIRMSIPADSSCRISATYRAGRFNTELPIDIQTENIREGPIRSIVGTFGKGGDATLKLTTHNGSISIRKQ